MGGKENPSVKQISDCAAYNKNGEEDKEENQKGLFMAGEPGRAPGFNLLGLNPNLGLELNLFFYLSFFFFLFFFFRDRRFFFQREFTFNFSAEAEADKEDKQADKQAQGRAKVIGGIGSLAEPEKQRSQVSRESRQGKPRAVIIDKAASNNKEEQQS